jgi:hypothetical protein
MILLKSNNLIKQIIRLSSTEKKMLIEAVFLLFYAKIMLSVFPFRRCICRFQPVDRFPECTQEEVVVAIRIAIARAGRLAFWRNRCLVSSCAARMMLERRKIGSVMYFGLLFNAEHSLQAHAWVVANYLWVTPKGGAEMTEIYTY